MMYTAVPKKITAVDLFLDMREEERLQEEGYMDSSFDDSNGDMDYWGSLYSSEALVDEMDRLNDLADDLDYDFVYDLD